MPPVAPKCPSSTQATRPNPTSIWKPSIVIDARWSANTAPAHSARSPSCSRSMVVAAPCASIAVRPSSASRWNRASAPVCVRARRSRSATIDWPNSGIPAAAIAATSASDRGLRAQPRQRHRRDRIVRGRREESACRAAAAGGGCERCGCVRACRQQAGSGNTRREPRNLVEKRHTKPAFEVAAHAPLGRCENELDPSSAAANTVRTAPAHSPCSGARSTVPISSALRSRRASNTTPTAAIASATAAAIGPRTPSARERPTKCPSGFAGGSASAAASSGDRVGARARVRFSRGCSHRLIRGPRAHFHQHGASQIQQLRVFVRGCTPNGPVVFRDAEWAADQPQTGERR